MNPVLETILKRASLRSFDPRKLEPEVEDAILSAAMHAPTAGNMMLYTILRIHDAETRSILARTCDNQPFIAEAPLTLVFLADFTRWTGLYEACGIPALAREQGIEWHGPTVADLMLCCSDALIAAQNAVIAAQSLGVGSCYIGDIMEQYETHRALFQLPPQAFPIAMLCLGYPTDGKMPEPRVRFTQRCIVHDERYHTMEPAELIGMVQEFKPGVDVQSYIQKFFLRKNGADFSAEMERSVQAALRAFLNQP
jgi:FMN reductase (NADPH)